MAIRHVIAALFTVSLVAAGSSNADNYFCRACGVLMHRAHAQFVERAEAVAEGVAAGEQKRIRIDMLPFVRRMCDDFEFRKTHSSSIVEGCEEIVRGNAAVVAGVFAGEAPTPENGFARTVDVCVDKLKLCDEIKERELPATCETCLAVRRATARMRAPLPSMVLQHVACRRFRDSASLLHRVRRVCCRVDRLLETWRTCCLRARAATAICLAST
jgi:hypothetical protein